MDRTTTMGGNTPLGNNYTTPATSAAGAKVESAVQAAHQTVDGIADKATAQVDRVSGSVHRAVNSAADTASAATAWASGLPDQAKQVQTKLTEAACTSIRARPLSTVAGAAIIGYLLGRLARL